MREQEMLNKIAESANSIDVPEELQPESVKERMLQKTGERKSYTQKKQNQKQPKRWKQLGNQSRYVAAAACLCLCFGLCSVAFYSDAGSRQIKSMQSTDMSAEKIQAHADLQNDSVDDDAEPIAEAGQEENEKNKKRLKRIGNMYTLASDYGKVYDVLKKGQQLYRGTSGTYEEKQVYAADDTIENSRFAQSEMDVLDSGNMKYTSADSSDNTNKVKEEESEKDFSTTNLQVAGVDESDIVKTDGKFIYVVQEEQVQILDVQNKVPVAKAVLRPDDLQDIDAICEMYVADQVLTLIIQGEKASMQKSEDNEIVEGEISEDTDGLIEEIPAQEDEASGVIPIKEKDEETSDDEAQKKRVMTDDMYYVKNVVVTKVLTYDISDPTAPRFLNSASQDGWYESSRKIGNLLYLFTNQSMYLADGISRKQALSDGNIIPCVNEKAVQADCIYLPKEGNQGVVMSCMDLANHCSVLDTKMLVSDNTQLYVSQDSVYFYYSEYVRDAQRTRIARFALGTDGMIQAKAAATLKGTIQDTFAIHQKEGYLQVLTSVTNAEPWENRVYVLNCEDMKIVGKLSGIAQGEQIYAARFVDDIGYFVTYRNTDPLFTVDFSNPKQPKIIGELKVTGFSEYLHFWSDKKLLGIGYETDPESGTVTGIKLSMFDISDPTKVKEKAKLVLEDADECEGMNDYKAVLVDRQKNLIALTTHNWEPYHEDYHVFSYQNGKFVSRIERQIAKKYGYQGYQWRSLYVEDTLYLVNKRRVIAFSIGENADGWKEIGKLRFLK